MVSNETDVRKGKTKVGTNTEITISGKTLRMVFNFNTVATIEGKTGRNLLTEAGWNNLTGSDVSTFFWATLQEHQPEITLVQAQRLLNSKNLSLVTQKLQEAWAGSDAA